MNIAQVALNVKARHAILLAELDLAFCWGLKACEKASAYIAHIVRGGPDFDSVEPAGLLLVQLPSTSGGTGSVRHWTLTVAHVSFAGLQGTFLRYCLVA